MMIRNKKLQILSIVGLICGLLYVGYQQISQTSVSKPTPSPQETDKITDSRSEENSPSNTNKNSLPDDPFIQMVAIQELRDKDYTDTQLERIETLPAGSNFNRYIARFEVDGLTQYGLLTIPQGETPAEGWPAIIFNHGYIDPDVYRTTERYESYQAGMARAGYVTFKPDYRGHGDSEGESDGSYSSDNYLIDVLHAFHAVQKETYVDGSRMGMWGHSMGGWITHRAMVIEPDIDAGVIWAGVVGSYADIWELWEPWWIRNGESEPSPSPDDQPWERWREYLPQKFGTPTENPDLWDAISATAFLEDQSGPVQLHHGTADSSVPYELAERYATDLEAAGVEHELYIYQGDDHNLSQNFSQAMRQTIDFLDTYVKGAQ